MVVVLTLSALAGEAYADPAGGNGKVATEPKITQKSAMSDPVAARLLIKAGQYRGARRFLQQWRPSGEEGRIEQLFLLGQVELRLGMHGHAAERFEEILRLRPDLAGVRLELARVYYLAGRDGRARYHFSRLPAEKLPSSVEAVVGEFLRRIDARRRRSVSFSASLLPGTERPKNETVLIGGVPFRLDEDAQSSSGPGMLVSAGVSFSPRLTNELRGVLGASAGAEVYRDSRWNDINVSGDIGLARLFDDGNLSGGARLERQWTGGRGYLHSAGPWARMRWRLTGSTRLEVGMSAGYRKHDKRHERDGWRVSLNPRFVHALDGRTSIEAGPQFEAVSAGRDDQESRLAGFGATVSRAFHGGLLLSLSSSTSKRRHAAPDPLFGVRRIDRNTRFGIRLRHRGYRFSGFAPYLGYSVERNRSSIPVNEYTNRGFVFGVSRRFL